MTPITPPDIRKGDQIRVEWTRSQCGSPRALEYVAPCDGTGMRKKMDATEWATARHFLLDRPTPPMALPSQATLGYLQWVSGSGVAKSVLAKWIAIELTTGDTHLYSDLGHEIPRRRVRSFEAVEVISIDALNHLRGELDSALGEGGGAKILSFVRPQRQEF